VIARENSAAFFSIGSPLCFPPATDESARIRGISSQVTGSLESLRFALGISRRVAKAATSGGLLSAAVRSFSGTQRRGGPVSATGHKFARAPVVARKTDLRRRQRRVSFFREETVLLPYPRRQEKRTLPRSRISTFYHIGVHARVK